MIMKTYYIVGGITFVTLILILAYIINLQQLVNIFIKPGMPLGMKEVNRLGNLLYLYKDEERPDNFTISNFLTWIKKKNLTDEIVVGVDGNGEGVILDHWKTPMKIETFICDNSIGIRFQVQSAGPDKKFDTPDDIIK